MFSAAIQPSVVSLFSSTSSAPLQLFTQTVDPSLPTDSCIHLLHDESSQPTPATPAALLTPPSQSQTDDPDYALNQTVLQIQSPTLRTTYIQCPPVGLHDGDKLPNLGIKHPWMHMQVRNMGREWAFEVGLVDHAGRMGILRLSTFQVRLHSCLYATYEISPPCEIYLQILPIPGNQRPGIRAHLRTYASLYHSKLRVPHSFSSDPARVLMNTYVLYPETTPAPAPPTQPRARFEQSPLQ
ncbi:hypothetical protein D9615_005985 [Tricholomella constricta]|uniref:CFA20 domain-containing protein n=1 Tax=Tricholomella constricta TaxID=117010 RepID=A0A8H5H9L6_9AGAR|nr:hypothetical protein D9615_005985 [Tricholomella constricta]